MNSALYPAAIVAASLMLVACNRRGDSDEVELVHPDSTSTNSAIDRSMPEQDRLVRAHLDGFGWVGRSGGAVHIPIERAMDLVVARKQSSGPSIDPAPEHFETDTAAQDKGRQLFVHYGCSICHDSDSPTHAPALNGIFGRRVRLNDGTFVIADDHYLSDSILHSKKQVVAGYAPFMPDYSSFIPEPDVKKLIEYLKLSRSSPST